MSETAQRIYDHFQQNRQYTYSSDPTTKGLEIEAINELESRGYIRITTQTIGYVIADVL